MPSCERAAVLLALLSLLCAGGASARQPPCRVDFCLSCYLGAPYACKRCAPGYSWDAVSKACEEGYRDVLIGGFTPEDGVQMARLGLATGRLTPRANSTALGAAPSALAYGRRGDTQFVLAANHLRGEPGTGLSLAAWVNREGRPTLMPLDAVATPDCNFVRLSPGKRWVLASAGTDGTLVRVPLLGGPRFGAPLPPLPDDDLGDLAHQVAFSPNARFAYAMFRDSNVVRAYSWSERTGAMAPLPGASTVSLPPGAGPRHLLFHPTLPVAYVICEGGNAVARFDWSPATGLLAPVDWAAEPGRYLSLVDPDAPPGGHLLGSELAASPDGRFLYASTRGGKGGFGSVATLAVDPDTGALDPLGWVGAAGLFPRHISLAAGGGWLLAVDQMAGRVLVYRRDAATGLLEGPTSTLDTSDFVPQPSWIIDVPRPVRRVGGK